MSGNVSTIRTPINLDTFEIVRTGHGAFPALSVPGLGAGQYNSGEAVTTIAHGLGYTPALFVNIAVASGSLTQGLPCPYLNNNLATSAGIWGILQAYADQNNVYLLSDLMTYNANGVVAANFYIAEFFLLKERIKRII